MYVYLIISLDFYLISWIYTLLFYSLFNPVCTCPGSAEVHKLKAKSGECFCA